LGVRATGARFTFSIGKTLATHRELALDFTETRILRLTNQEPPEVRCKVVELLRELA
jgi:hypothetical protein